jgi:nitrate/nitrite transporter NarK
MDQQKNISHKNGLVLDRVTKLYQSVFAVDHVCLKVENRGFLAIVGPTGCGKKTLLRLIAGVDWIIVAVSLISMAFWFGIRSKFSVFYVALLDDFPWNRGASAKKAIRSQRFWALMAFPFCSAIGVYIVLVHNFKFLVDQGTDKMTAAFVLAMAGIVSAAFRIIWGWLSDYIGRELTYTMGLICGCIGLVSLLLLEATGAKNLVYAFLIFFGMGWGATAPQSIP